MNYVLLPTTRRGEAHLAAGAPAVLASRPLRVCLVLLAALLLAVGVVPSALATTGHNFAGQFGAPGNGAGAFGYGGPSGLAVRQSTGDVFVADGGHTNPDFSPAPRIERFDAGGTYQGFFGLDASAVSSPGSLAIDPAGAASVYVGALDNATGTGAVVKYSAAGVFAYALTPPAGIAFSYPVAVAVDPATGTVFVSATDTTTGQPVVQDFSGTGLAGVRFDGTDNGTAFGSVAGLAVDASGRVYVLDSSTGHVLRYSATGSFQIMVDDAGRGSAVAVSADPVSSEVYVVEAAPGGQQVTHFSAGGTALVNTFGAGKISGASAIGVRSATGTVYTADLTPRVIHGTAPDGSPTETSIDTNVVERFTTFVGPTVQTTAAASVDPTSETLNGTVDPGGAATTFHFEYGVDTSYGTSTAETSAGDGAIAVPVTDVAGGLSPNTVYHVRLVASNGDGTIVGDDQAFTTASASPLVDDVPASASPIGPTGATLNATIDPKGSATTFHFEYGTTPAYGSSTPNDTTSAGAGQGDTTVSTPITGLTPGTTYYFRVSADNGTGGAQNGAQQTFTTAPAAAAGATDVTGASATLTGAVNPSGRPASFHFEYGATTAYGKSTAERTPGSAGNELAVTTPVSGLQPGTTYHVRAVLISTESGVVTNGADGTFTTGPAPAATTGAVTGVGIDEATFAGTFDTHATAGSYQFVVASSTSPYVAKTAPVSASGAGTASGGVDDLPAGGTYTVRLAVTSGGVTTVGEEVTFSTASEPPVAPPRPAPKVTNAYGCTAPVLAAYDAHPRPGETIHITGTDLGIGGTVAFGTKVTEADSWSATGLSIDLPDDATGTLPLTVNCGTVSNTIAITIYQPPSNTFTATGKVNGNTATVSVKVPGPGTITATGASVKKAIKHAAKAATTSVKLTLTAKAITSLKAHRKLAVTLTVRFTPTGGTAATKAVHITFTRKAGR